MGNPIAANVLGTLGAVCWSIQLIPQIIINYRRHNTIGLQRSMMLLWAFAGIPLGVYNITGNFSIALQIQPQILTVLSLITWIQCFHYDDKWSTSKCILVVTALGALLGGIEVALVFALRAGSSQLHHWPTTLMGVLSTILLSAGVLRHYYDIYIHHTVRGISFIFVAIDAAGDVFSLISVFFQPRLDILGMVIYATEFVLWCGVFVAGAWLNLRPWMRKRWERELREEGTVAGTRDEQSVEETSDRGGQRGITTDFELERIGSARSVFRTSGSMRRGITSSRISVNS